MFNWAFNRFYFQYASPAVTSVWGVSAVAILDSSVNCVCVWLTKIYLCQPTVLPQTVTIRR